MFRVLLLVSFLVSSSSGDETYENSSNICSRCSCSDAPTFTIDCSNQNFRYMLATWPSAKPIKANFTRNNFSRLEKIPPTRSPVEITLSFCNISALDPAVFDEAPLIKHVDLSHNLLTSEELRPDRFRGGSQNDTLAIEHLDLSYNTIHSLDKDIFEFLPRLKWLSLEGNDFKVLDVHTQMALSSVPQLTSLNLAGNELLDVVAAAVEKLTLLRFLDLSNNDLDFVPERLPASLEVLVVDRNPIFEIERETFAALPKLREISANNLTKLTRVGAGAFSNPDLSSLHICNNSALSEIHPEAFTCHNLKEVFLSGNNLSVIPENLLDCSSVSVVDLRNNPLVCTCAIYEISRKLPNDSTCLDSSSATLRVSSLTSDICEAKVARVIGQIRYQHVSIPLAGLIVCLMVGMMAAVAMGYGRYRRFLRNGEQQGYAPQVVYSPLLNARV